MLQADLTAKIIKSKEDFMASCKNEGYDKLIGSEHRFLISDLFQRTCNSNDFDWASYALSIPNSFRDMVIDKIAKKGDNFYTHCLIIFDLMIRYSSLSAFS